nr:uncharacterized protein LOC111843331 isoform X2 [Paramormyrops kingsleyae]
MDGCYVGQDAVNRPSPTPPSHTISTRHPVDAEVTRLFGPYMQGGRRSTGRRHLAVPALSSYTHTFCCLDEKNVDVVPTRNGKERLAAAGLGEKRLTFKGSQTNPHDFREFLFALFPKFREGGGFELLKISGSTRSRQLSLIPCPNEGYYVKHLKDAQTQLGHATIFIRPLQRNLSLEPICQPECSSQLIGPPQKCVTCGEEFPFSHIKAHSGECIRLLQSTVDGQMEADTEGATTPRSEDRYESTLRRPQESLTARSSNTDISVPNQGNMPVPGASQEHLPNFPIIDLDQLEKDWKIENDPSEAAKRYREDLLNKHATLKPLNLTVDLGDSEEERERTIISFYKIAHVERASPLKCILKVPGGAHLFDGETDHLIPSTSHFLLESDFFVVAGRMIGHSFLHGGPCLSGLSPAILHVLFDGSPEEATIDIKDCADLDIRETIKLLEGTTDLSPEEKHTINELALSWDLPPVISGNRRWLFDKLLLHAVLGRTSRQVKHLRRGLKETQIWPLLTERKDIIPLLFPRASQIQCTSQMVLDKIKWPTQDEDEDKEVSLEDACRITGFLRTFIENAWFANERRTQDALIFEKSPVPSDSKETSSPSLLEKFVQFWVGWNVLPTHLDVEVVESSFPRSSTCFYLLKLPGHYKEYSVFERDLLAAIWSVDTGFGMV